MNEVFSIPMKQPQRLLYPQKQLLSQKMYHPNYRTFETATRSICKITPGARRNVLRLTVRRGRTNYGGTG